MGLLDEIFAHKRDEVARQRAARSLAAVQAEAGRAAAPLDFVAALRRSPTRPALIAEIKRASPSRGLLVSDFDPLRLAGIYRENGAAAISVLTDERYFGGHLDHLRLLAGQSPRLPILRKDFLCDPYQIYQARAAGADAVLLIAAYLPMPLLAGLHELALRLGMAALVEVHTAGELEAALACRPALIGINNRDLHDFSVNLETSIRLAAQIPAEICVVAESGIHAVADVDRLAQIPRPAGAIGVDAILVGETLVTAADVAATVRGLARQVTRVF
jgi:indole-3-glycerol phosphate synthase